jgi:hypothetical protein
MSIQAPVLFMHLARYRKGLHTMQPYHHTSARAPNSPQRSAPSTRTSHRLPCCYKHHQRRQPPQQLCSCRAAPTTPQLHRKITATPECDPAALTARNINHRYHPQSPSPLCAHLCTHGALCAQFKVVPAQHTNRSHKECNTTQYKRRTIVTTLSQPAWPCTVQDAALQMHGTAFLDKSIKL